MVILMKSGQRYDTAELDPAKYREPKEHRPRKRRSEREHRVPRWVYRIILILVLSFVAMLLWFNRANLTPENVLDWAQTQFVGLGVGDGFPYKITGNVVSPGNFKSVDKELVMVRDTELTVLNSTAKEMLSRQHSFSKPVMKLNGQRMLIYNLGGKGYQVESQSRTLVKNNTDQNILCGALARNGRYALVTEEEGYCGYLTAYLPTNEQLFHYWFSEYYPTAAALNETGTKALVTGVSSKNGALTSAVYLIDFGSSKPVAPLAEYTDNMMLDADYFDSGTAVAVGDRMTAVFDTNSGKKVNFDYEGQQLTAYDMNNGKTALSLSPYENAASTKLVVLDKNGGTSVTVSLKQSVKSVSLYGDTVAALADGKVMFYSAVTGAPQGSCDAGEDAKAIALASDSSVYILGVSEVRTASAR